MLSDIRLKLFILGFPLFILHGTVNSQIPSLLRSTLGTGGASVLVSARDNKISLQQSIGQNSVSGVFSVKNLELRQGFIQPLVTNRSFHEPVNNSIRVYPNPFSAIVYLKLNKEVTGEIDLLISDVAGRPVFAERIPVEGVIQVNLSSLHKGIYILKIRKQNMQFSYKIIKY